jgi:hypothetical protein
LCRLNSIPAETDLWLLKDIEHLQNGQVEKRQTDSPLSSFAAAFDRRTHPGPVQPDPPTGQALPQAQLICLAE